MKVEDLGYSVDGDYLVGPFGRLKFSDLESVYMETSSETSPGSFGLGIVGMIMTGLLMNTSILAAFVVFGITFAYFIHSKKKVFGIIKGAKVQIHTEICLPLVLTDERAEQRCKYLMEFIQRKG